MKQYTKWILFLGSLLKVSFKLTKYTLFHKLRLHKCLVVNKFRKHWFRVSFNFCGYVSTTVINWESKFSLLYLSVLLAYLMCLSWQPEDTIKTNPSVVLQTQTLYHLVLKHNQEGENAILHNSFREFIAQTSIFLISKHKEDGKIKKNSESLSLISIDVKILDQILAKRIQKFI